MGEKSILPELVRKFEAEILERWMKDQREGMSRRADLMSEAELREQSREFLGVFGEAIRNGDISSILGPEWEKARSMLEGVSRSRARQGFTPSETATFVFSLKKPLFALLQKELGKDPGSLAAELWAVTGVLDKLGLFTTEKYTVSREEVIKRQQEEMLELSTPVVKLWDQVLALPLIGTLDSARTQIVMESLLQQIVATASSVAIIDITGVPVVDTLVAQHLVKTVSAARLMGADCLISGIRPQIAQTMVHLGVAFTDIVTKATLADAIRYAFTKLGYKISRPGT